MSETCNNSFTSFILTHSLLLSLHPSGVVVFILHLHNQFITEIATSELCWLQSLNEVLPIVTQSLARPSFDVARGKPVSSTCCPLCRLYTLFACPNYFPLPTLIPPGKLQKESPRMLWVFKCVLALAIHQTESGSVMCPCWACMHEALSWVYRLDKA